MTAALLNDGGAAPLHDARPALSRGELFFWSGLVLLANALAGLALKDVAERDFVTSLTNLFGISAIVLVACAASLVLAKADTTPPSKRDWVVAGICLLVAIVPNASLARFATSFFGAYLLFASTPGSAMRRAGIIVVALGGSLFWGAFIVTTLGHPVLELDAILTSWLYGLDRVGNTINFAGGAQGGIIIAGACSSWHGLSIALLFWVLLYQWYEIPVRKMSFVWLALAMLATLAVNSLRLAAMASYPQYLKEIHHGVGATIAAWATLLLVVAICIYGERRAIFAR